MARKKKALPPGEIPPAEPPRKERPWWRKTDAELLKERASEVRSSLGWKKVELTDKDRSILVSELKRRDPSIPNLLDAVFAKNEGVEEDGEFLKVPVYKSRRGEGVAKALHLKTRRRIRLDEYGWSVWRLLDGRRTVEEIGERLSESHGDAVEPLYPRLARFMAYLVNLGLVRDVNRP
jgi:hypothetical protein